MSLPSTGSTNWGVPLNDFITNTVLAEATLAEQTIVTHQTANDPHGDRAFAQSLVTPITTGVNQPNGYVKLDSTGRLSTSIIPTGGGRTDTIDVVADFQAPVSATFAGIVDCSTALNAALTATAAAGGGEVWVGGGFYGIGETLIIPPNTWLHLAPAAVFVRIIGSAGTAPLYMATNYSPTPVQPPDTTGAGNILVQGGVWNYQSAGTGGSAMAFADASFIEVSQTAIQPIANTSAIVFAGITGVTCRDVEFQYPAPTGTGSQTRASLAASGSPAIQLTTTQTLTAIPPSITANSPCMGVSITSCASVSATATDGIGVYTSVNGLVGTLGGTASMYHTGIGVNGCYSNAFPGNALNAHNWAEANVLGNVFNFNNGVLINLTWNPVTPPAVTNITPDFWHTITMDSGWTVLSPFSAPAYRMSADGMSVQFTGAAQFSSNITNGTNLNGNNPLPAAYQPNHQKTIFSGGDNRSQVLYLPSGILQAAGNSGIGGADAFIEIEGTAALT
jgi:hypothetical protein